LARTVHALGGAGLVTLPGTADLTNSKVLRGSMGSLFRLPNVHASETDFLAWVHHAKGQLIVSAADGADLRSTPRIPGPMALLVGNEGAGVGPALSAAATARIAIPLQAGAESLNVAVAAGIILYEVLRER
jgi:TrmH family RNA methyltransferase